MDFYVTEPKRRVNPTCSGYISSPLATWTTAALMGFVLG